VLSAQKPGDQFPKREQFAKNWTEDGSHNGSADDGTDAVLELFLSVVVLSFENWIVLQVDRWGTPRDSRVQLANQKRSH
jgi:hypothetical protein